MKAHALLFFLISLPVLCCTGQEIKQQQQQDKKAESKLEAFLSRTGVITKLTDYHLPALKLWLEGTAETRIRKISQGKESKFFFQIEKTKQYSTHIASVEYADLLECIKALSALKAEVENDAASNPDYLENKFVTVDGFAIGYYIDKGKAQWFVKFDKYGSDNTIFLKDAAVFETALQNAKEQIDQLRK